MLRSTAKLPGCPTTTRTASGGSAARSAVVTRIGTEYRPSGVPAATVTVTVTDPVPVAGSTVNDPLAGCAASPVGGSTWKRAGGSVVDMRNTDTVS